MRRSFFRVTREFIVSEKVGLPCCMYWLLPLMDISTRWSSSMLLVGSVAPANC